jgi:hypothetical protein
MNTEPELYFTGPRPGQGLEQRGPVIILEMKSSKDGHDAIAIVDRDTGRLLAFLGPDLPHEDRHASLDDADIADLAKLFTPPPNAWFAPRLRGLVFQAAHEVLHGWRGARDAKAMLDRMIETPSAVDEIMREDRQAQFLTPFFAALSTAVGHNPLAILQHSRSLLLEAREAFIEIIPRGRPTDETREAFLMELSLLALDNGMAMALPHHRDADTAMTPLLAFGLTARNIVVNRVQQATKGQLPAAARHRLASFRCSNLALIQALERIQPLLSAKLSTGRTINKCP